MALRSPCERVIQTLWFEGVGLALVAPLYAWVAGAEAGDSLLLVAVVSLVVMAWAAIFNTVFDAVEWRWTARGASARPRRWRLVHAVAFETTAIAVTTPVIHVVGDMPWWQAFQTDLALTLAYMVYGYAFHSLYDRWRPVGPSASHAVGCLGATPPTRQR